ncbi:MAG: hypothetical protein LBT60_02855, partial [Oscillospiraceae bacterium]|nr:hypothetical protein [Oscillospiraceae bacterium]
MEFPFGLRPVGVTGLLDNTFRVYRRNLGAVLLFALLIGGLSQFLAQAVLLLPAFRDTYAANYNDFLQRYLDMLSGGLTDYSYAEVGDLYGQAGRVFAASAVSMVIGLLVG